MNVRPRQCGGRGGKDDVVHVSYGYGLFTAAGAQRRLAQSGGPYPTMSSGNTDRQISLCRPGLDHPLLHPLQRRLPGREH